MEPHEQHLYTLGEWSQYAGQYSDFAPPVDFRLSPTNCALIVIDAQKKTFDRNATRGLAEGFTASFPRLSDAYFKRIADIVLPNIISILHYFRRNSLKRFFTVVGPSLPSGEDLPFAFRVQYSNALRDTGESLITSSSSEFKVIDELYPHDNELIIHKYGRSAFVNTNLHTRLLDEGIDQLILAGGATHACIDSTGRSAADLGYKVTILEDACVSQFPLLHETTMINFMMSMGRVMSTSDIIVELEDLSNYSRQSE